VPPPPAPQPTASPEPIRTPLPGALPAAPLVSPPAAGAKPAPTPPPRARLAPVPPPPADAVEAIASELAQACRVEGPLLVTVEHGAAQSTISFAVCAATLPLDVFALARIARAHGAALVSVSDAGGATRATLLLPRPPRAAPPPSARPGVLARLHAAWVAWRAA